MNMKKILILVFIFICNIAVSQTVIQMKKEGGVSVIPCKVNGLQLSFIFDTGASDVTISLTEATFMLKNGYLSKNDILGTSNYSDANGDISEGININLREIEIQGLKLYNVKAAIVKNMDAPLLLGQTAISKLGVVQLDLNSNTLTILSNILFKPENKMNNSNSNVCKDIDGNVYKTIKIGTQIWMAENLNVKHYRNGDPIPQITKVTGPKKWHKLKTGAWCNYNIDFKNESIHGKLYNWYAVNDQRGIAPEGWHVPSDEEWLILNNYLGKDAGIKMKSLEGWEGWGQKGNGTNISGFCGKPCGSCSPWFDYTGNNVNGYWWSSSIFDVEQSWCFALSWNNNYLYRGAHYKNNGFSIRCIKN
jgi:uncharacterized protein (TIGR02145 family)